MVTKIEIVFRTNLKYIDEEIEHIRELLEDDIGVEILEINQK